MTAKEPGLVAVIIAGGAGTRFWPLSTEERPKQFLRLFGERSLLQQSFDRVSSLTGPERTLVLTGARHVGLVREQLPEIPAENVIGEPLRRDTAAAVALGALVCRGRWGDPVMCVLTADHLITPAEEFRAELLSAARSAATEPVLYTFGVPPTYPATCYGYLERGERVREDNGIEHYSLLRFKEKPDQKTAVQYLRSGNYLWNSGMFVWRVGTILDELKRQLPAHIATLAPAVEREGTREWEVSLTEAFRSLEATSIDYGVMEGARRVNLVATRFEWNDVGGWLALERHLDIDGAGNAHRGALETLDAGGNLVFCEDESERVALIGVRGLVLIRAGKSTLVVPKERAEEIKSLVRRLDGKA